ncbi:MAG TPA: thymidine phosphorylase [Polyangiaceae bacterium]|nr:thymidine phosphorylase [Polyangiaceae bacterium]
MELIRRKRDGGELSPEELRWMISGLLAGSVTDYQISAFLMAVYLRGMSDAETVALTHVLRDSGKKLQLGSVKRPKIDKHSTGGVGDKISICLAPLVAACGVAVPMISGRGLGHTGGTLDKLEAIPGFDVHLPARRFEQLVRNVGTCLIGQTDELAPADRKLYALRDVTATVESIPLIVASILSKKLAEGIEGLVLDVKVGRGAFMKDEASARRLAKALIRVGRLSGIRVVALLTEMSTPIGLTVGNALETREAIDVLKGGGPSDTRELTLALGAEMLRLGGVSTSAAQARSTLLGAIASGRALECFARVVHEQGGDASVIEHPERLPQARKQMLLKASEAGVVTEIDALELGLAAVELGAGRTRADQAVDPGAGIEILAPLGTRVRAGDALARIGAARTTLLDSAAARVSASFKLGKRARPACDRVLGVLR